MLCRIVLLSVFLTDSQPRSEGSSESSGLRGLRIEAVIRQADSDMTMGQGSAIDLRREKKTVALVLAYDNHNIYEYKDEI